MLLSLLTIVPLISAGPFEKHPEAAEDIRAVTAKERLTSEPDAVAIYAKGMCCPSCAIGVRKKIVKLEFVDSSRFVSGVELDPKTQLAMVALKAGQAPDSEALAQAIVDAGYDPVLLYILRDGQLQTTPLNSR